MAGNATTTHYFDFNSSIDYQIQQSPYGLVVCYPQYILAESTVQRGWQSGSALASSLPFFITQLFVANLSYRVLYYLTRPLQLPPFVAQILCGLMLGPSAMGQFKFMLDNVFPFRYTMVLETFANLALVFYIFLLGLEMDLSMIKLTRTKALTIAAAGILVPFAAGAGLYTLPKNNISLKPNNGFVYWAIVLACTNFPDLARTLADLKLLRTDIGRLAMAASIITDLCTWVLLIVAFSLFNKEGHVNNMMGFALVSTAVFIIFCIFVVRPFIRWAFAKTTKGGHVSESHVWYILGGVVLCGLITDMCGTHSIVGAFIFGLIIPQDHTIRNMIEEKLHDFISGILMPLFFIISGLRTNLVFVFNFTSLATVSIVVLVSFVVKAASTFIMSFTLGMPTKDGLALGLLMNTKGILALVVLNAGRDTKALDSQMFGIMILALLVMSLVVQPILAATYRPKKKLVHYKHRTIQRIKQEAEFCVLSCVHNLPNASGIINLLQVSNATKQSPLNIFAIHLVELTGRTTASMLIMDDECKPKVNFSDRVRAESDQIAEAFETVEVNNDAVTVQTVTAVSPYTTMHEDICSLAEDKRACLIMLPYHKQLTADGRMGEGNASHADVNRNVLHHAPCSVGILVDRGMGMTRSESSHGEKPKKQVAMLFVGGPDDREALTYAWRIAEVHTINLTVIRFVPGREAVMSSINKNDEKEGETTSSYEREKQVDDECIYEFNFKTMNDPSISYIEKVVTDGQETIAAIRELEDNNSYDLYIVGRGYGTNSPVTAGLSDWSSSPELGTIGDTLASSNFTMHASVLVLQQYSAANRNAMDHNETREGQTLKSTGHDIEPFMKSVGKKLDDDEDDEEYEDHYHHGHK